MSEIAAAAGTIESIERLQRLFRWFKALIAFVGLMRIVEERELIASTKRTQAIQAIKSLRSQRPGTPASQRGQTAEWQLIHAQIFLSDQTRLLAGQTRLVAQYHSLLTHFRADRTFSSLCEILTFLRRHEPSFLEDYCPMPFGYNSMAIWEYRDAIQVGLHLSNEQELQSLITLNQVQHGGLIEKAIAAGAYDIAMRWIHQLHPSSVIISAAASSSSSCSTQQHQQQQLEISLISTEQLSSLWGRLPDLIKSAFERELHQLASQRKYMIGEYYHQLIAAIPHGLDPTMMLSKVELESLNSIDEEHIKQSAIQLARLNPQPQMEVALHHSRHFHLSYQHKLPHFKSELLHAWQHHSKEVRSRIKSADVMIPDLANIVCEYLELDPIEKKAGAASSSSPSTATSSSTPGTAEEDTEMSE